MAIGDDISVAANGDIRYTGTTDNYTVLELHRFLGDLADNPQAVTSSSDFMDISFPTPSVRVFDTIITLNFPYNIDDDLATHLYGGSLRQEDVNGLTTLYSGLRVVGAVNTPATQIQIIQDNALYDGDSPFWGTQSDPYNGGGTTHFRCLIKSRESGYDIDGKRIRLRAGHWGDTYASFDVTLGVGESVGAISTTPDPQNITAQATVKAWTGSDDPTNVEGYQLIDIQDGNGDQPYYSQWTYDANISKMRALWEWGKDLTNISPLGNSATPYGIDGDLFRGVTDEIDYSGQTTNFQEDEFVIWGTHIWYDNEAGGTLTRGNAVVFSGGAAGKIMYANGTDEVYVALEDTSITILNDETFTEYNMSTGVATGVTAVVDTGGGAIEDNGTDGGEGWILADNDNGATGTLWIQRTHGLAPADTVPLLGITSGGNGVVSSTPTAPTIPAVFLGSYTGSLIGAYGIGIDPDDLASGDTVTDLEGDINLAPNNVTYTVSNLISGEDYLLVGEKDSGSADYNWLEMALNTTLDTASETSLVIGHGNGDNATIPADAPISGTLRVTLDDGRHRRITYTAKANSTTFTIPDESWVTPNNATAGVGVMLAFIDKLATGTSEAFTLKYSADRTLWQRRRDGGTAGDGIPTVTWEQQGNLTDTGGSAIASRLTDA